MNIPAMRLDFAPDAHRFRRGPVALLVLGIVALTATAGAYLQLRDQADGLELRLTALTGVDAPEAGEGVDSGRLGADADAAIAELATPWSRLLVELEQAAADSRNSVALLAIEPDRENGRIRILAESRTLPAAVAFTRRLQESEALQYPMLESHEIQTSDTYRPVRFQLTATWRLRS